MLPAANVIERGLGDVLAEYESVTDGAVADYIPELATVDPDRFGIALASVRGHVYSAGDDELAFTIQSSSKPFVYALAIGELGSDVVERHVGFEPSGEPFNAISLDATTGRPDNPLINAGAIVTTSLIPGGDHDARFERIHRFLSACAGHPLGVDEAVFRSEHETGDRNRALAFLARSTGVLGSDVEAATSVYFRQCSILVTARDLSVMAATLANNGVNPVTGETVMHEDVARTTLAVMAMCGMYNSSGEWMVRVGLPAKSGVGGGIVAVKPGQFGVGVFSPRLDDARQQRARRAGARTAVVGLRPPPHDAPRPRSLGRDPGGARRRHGPPDADRGDRLRLRRGHPDVHRVAPRRAWLGHHDDRARPHRREPPPPDGRALPRGTQRRPARGGASRCG